MTCFPKFLGLLCIKRGYNSLEQSSWEFYFKWCKMPSTSWKWSFPSKLAKSYHRCTTQGHRESECPSRQRYCLYCWWWPNQSWHGSTAWCGGCWWTGRDIDYVDNLWAGVLHSNHCGMAATTGTTEWHHMVQGWCHHMHCLWSAGACLVHRGDTGDWAGTGRRALLCRDRYYLQENRYFQQADQTIAILTM